MASWSSRLATGCEAETAERVCKLATYVEKIGKGRSLTASCLIAACLGRLDLICAIASAGRSSQNACRNLHSLIHKRGLTVPLRIHTVEIPVCVRRPKLKKLWVHYPVILPTTWVEYLLREQSHLILAGHMLEAMTWKDELKGFWDAYLLVDPSHPMNCPGGPPKELTVPFYIHGDEGRGKYKPPIMIQAIQPVISFKGPAYKNSSGCRVSSVRVCSKTYLLGRPRHSFCTRFLFAVLPSELYWNDDTLASLNEFFAADLVKAFHDGVLVP